MNRSLLFRLLGQQWSGWKPARRRSLRQSKNQVLAWQFWISMSKLSNKCETKTNSKNQPMKNKKYVAGHDHPPSWGCRHQNVGVANGFEIQTFGLNFIRTGMLGNLRTGNFSTKPQDESLDTRLLQLEQLFSVSLPLSALALSPITVMMALSSEV